MASNTTNLNLLKKDPTTDGNDTFNIKTMLNDNWDKIDTYSQQVDTNISNININISTLDNNKIEKTDYTKTSTTTVATGTDSEYTATLNGLTQYQNGLRVTIIPTYDNADSVTLNVNSLGAVTIKDKDNNSLAAGTLNAGVPYELIYYNSNFFLMGEGGGGKEYTAPTVNDTTFITGADEKYLYYTDYTNSYIYKYDKKGNLISSQNISNVKGYSENGYVTCSGSTTLALNAYDISGTLLNSSSVSITTLGANRSSKLIFALYFNGYYYLGLYYASGSSSYKNLAVYDATSGTLVENGGYYTASSTGQYTNITSFYDYVVGVHYTGSSSGNACFAYKKSDNTKITSYTTTVSTMGYPLFTKSLSKNLLPYLNNGFVMN